MVDNVACGTSVWVLKREIATIKQFGEAEAQHMVATRTNLTVSSRAKNGHAALTSETDSILVTPVLLPVSVHHQASVSRLLLPTIQQDSGLAARHHVRCRWNLGTLVYRRLLDDIPLVLAFLRQHVSSKRRVVDFNLLTARVFRMFPPVNSHCPMMFTVTAFTTLAALNIFTDLASQEPIPLYEPLVADRFCACSRHCSPGAH